jgi:hypothetical protein
MAMMLLVAHLMAAGLPLVADHLVTGPKSRVTLTNTSNQAVTAWALAVITHPQPDRIHREVETVDGYLSAATHGLAGTSERLERLEAGQSREIALDALPDGASVEVVAVIFDDGTAMGEESIVAPIFARRVRERDALGVVAQTFADVLAAQHGAQALDALRARLDALPNRDEVPCRAAIEAVETYKARVADRTPEQIDESLRTYAAFVAREWELAKKAATRKS